MEKVKVMILCMGTPRNVSIPQNIIEVELEKSFSWGGGLKFKVVKEDGNLQLRTSKYNRHVLGCHIRKV